VGRKTYVSVIQEALFEEMRRDQNVFLMGEDVRIGVFAGTRGLHAEFGDKRVIDSPISELGVTGACIGAAATGLRPIVDLMFSSFLYLAIEQLADQAGAMRYMFGGQTTVPIVFVVQNGSGASAGHHHSQSAHPMFMNIPLIKTVMPSTPYDAKGLLKSAIRDNNPVIFLNHLSLGGQRQQVPDEEYLIPIGKGDVKRAGKDVTICTAGLMVHHSLKAAAALEKDGVDVEVIDLRSLKPWDEDLVLESVAKTGHFVAVDEAYPTCGAASEWAATVAEKGFKDLKSAVVRVTGKPLPIPFSPKLEKAVIPSVEEIIAAVKKSLS
jgi:acetoin:2,6-dichlorophenolindophenol oxidoreductase subunit beta